MRLLLIALVFWNASNDRYVVFGLAGGKLWAQDHNYAPYQPRCGRHYLANNVTVEIVPELDTPFGVFTEGGWTDIEHCRIVIGQGSYDRIRAASARCGACWLRTEGFGLLVHEYAHIVLWDGSHAHTPNKLEERPEAEVLMPGWRAQMPAVRLPYGQAGKP